MWLLQDPKVDPKLWSDRFSSVRGWSDERAVSGERCQSGHRKTEDESFIGIRRWTLGVSNFYLKKSAWAEKNIFCAQNDLSNKKIILSTKKYLCHPSRFFSYYNSIEILKNIPKKILRGRQGYFLVLKIIYLFERSFWAQKICFSAHANFFLEYSWIFPYYYNRKKSAWAEKNIFLCSKWSFK